MAYDETQLLSIAKNGLALSPITEVRIEKYIYGWKEIEFETMRDAADNCIAVCSMENFDPVGVHTGDSIVIAPAVTLSDKEYQTLRSASLSIIRALKIEGGCNCQFALNPDSFEYAVIEVNPRVSRSSALASKATGYPIAKVAGKIALGYTLDEIQNEITGKTCACFEPTLDYVVVKMPKWPFDKFVHASRALGTQMKATGEVMAMAPSFEMAIMKAVRGAEISLDTLNLPEFAAGDARERLHAVDDRRLFANSRRSSGRQRGRNPRRYARGSLVPLQTRKARAVRAGSGGGPLDKSAYIAANARLYRQRFCALPAIRFPRAAKPCTKWWIPAARNSTP